MDKFIELFKENLEIESNITPETKFRELEEWSSLAALTVLSMIDDEYDIALSGNEMRGTNTIGELFALIESKK